MVKINMIFHSIHGHIYKMAEAIAEGAREVEGAEVGIYQVPEFIRCLRLCLTRFLRKWGQSKQKNCLPISLC